MSDPAAGPAGRDAKRLVVAVDRLIGQVQHWTPPRWRAASGASGAGAVGTTRGDTFHALVQRVADLAAAAEGQPSRPVPRLENDLALPDQLAVVSRDMLRAAPEAAVLAEAVEAVRKLRTSVS